MSSQKITIPARVQAMANWELHYQREFMEVVTNEIMEAGKVLRSGYLTYQRYYEICERVIREENIKFRLRLRVARKANAKELHLDTKRDILGPRVERLKKAIEAGEEPDVSGWESMTRFNAEVFWAEEETLTELEKYQLIRSVKTCGSYHPDDLMYMIEEDMTPESYDKVYGFLSWLTDNDRKFGHGNIDEVFREYVRQSGGS